MKFGNSSQNFTFKSLFEEKKCPHCSPVGVKYILDNMITAKNLSPIKQAPREIVFPQI